MSFLKSSDKQSVWWCIALLLTAMFSIQSGAALAKSLFPVIGAYAVTSLRIVLATMILLIVLRPWKKRAKWVFSKTTIFWLIAYGIALGLMNLLFYLSLQTIPLGIAVGLEFTGPLVLTLLASRSWFDFVWLFLAGCGLYFLLMSNVSLEQLDFNGALLAMGAGICWAIYILIGKRAGKIFGSSTVTLGLIFSSIIISPIGFIMAEKGVFTLSVLPLAFLVALLSTAIPYSLEMVALTRLPAKTFGTFMSLEPVVAAICGMIFLHERLSLLQWSALFAIIFASVGAMLSVSHKGKVITS